MATSNAIVLVGQLGADTYVQMLNGVLYTEDQIGFMADRILYTEGEIGEMADRIVYVIELSQFNTIKAMYVVVDLTYLGFDFSSNMSQYAITVNPVSYIPWLSQRSYEQHYFPYPRYY